MDCSYMNQKRPCGCCPQMMTPPAPPKDCCCGEPPALIPNRPAIEPRMPAQAVMPTQAAMPAYTAPSTCMAMPAHMAYSCTNTGVGGMEMYPVGMGYVPWQQWQQTYPMDKGLIRGTIFPDLDLPFMMGRCR